MALVIDKYRETGTVLERERERGRHAEMTQAGFKPGPLR